MKPKLQVLLWITVVLLVLAALAPAIVMYCKGDRYGLFYLIAPVLFSLLLGIQLLQGRRHNIRFVAKLNTDCENTELAALQQLPLGMCVLNEEQHLIQYNPYFSAKILGDADCFGTNLPDLIPFDPKLPEQQILWQNRYYSVTSLPFLTDDDTMLTTFFWTDVTEYEHLRYAYDSSRPCVLLIMVDNYEDLIQNAKESTKLEMGAAIEKLLENFISETNGIIRRLKTDRFIAILEEQHIQKIMEGKFALLDKAREIRVDGTNTVTFSIGVGHGGVTLQESEQFAAQCLDMALGRGGDQAAVHTENGFRFFGGVSKGVEKKSRAKTRIIAGAIQEMIQASDRVYLMGHRFGDLDSIGSACGMAGAIRLMGVPVSVVVDPKKNLSQQLIAMVQEEVDGLFLTPTQAVETITDNSLLMIVDTHNKEILESDALYQMASRVVVIDHHRKTVNFVDNAILFHHEPYASSTCEMVTELIQYFKLPGMVTSVYANSLLAGIMLDTKNFVMRTGVRTFEAAAFLRKIGADTVKVKCLFSGSIDAYRARTDIVGAADIIGRHAVAIASEHTPDLRLAAPQAADELLSIENVHAAYVIYKIGHLVHISARSLGSENVQVIMEMLGGGGHQTMAAAQLPDVSEEEAKQQLLHAIAERQAAC